MVTYFDRPIFITGCARSGTSLTAGVIERCGAWFGNTTGPTKHNRKGQYENQAIRDGIVKPYLKKLGVDPLGQKPLPDIIDLVSYPKLRQDVLDVLNFQGYIDGPWAYKGAKLCLIWPIWAAAFPNARWVIVRRDSEDIVRSCMRTSFMRAYKHEEGWRNWVKHHEARFSEMLDPVMRVDVREIWPTHMIRGNFEEAEKVVRGLGLKWDPIGVRKFIAPGLWNKGEKA